MTYSARIEAGKVVQVLVGVVAGLVQTEQRIGIGWTYDGETFTAPAPTAAELEERRSATVDMIERQYSAVFRALTENCPAEERDTWEIKRQAVVRYDAGEATATDLAMFDAECAHTGEAREVLIGTIRAKSAAYVGMIGTLRGIHRKAMHSVGAASDMAGIDAALATLDIDTAAFLGGLSP